VVVVATSHITRYGKLAGATEVHHNKSNRTVG